MVSVRNTLLRVTRNLYEPLSNPCDNTMNEITTCNVKGIIPNSLRHSCALSLTLSLLTHCFDSLAKHCMVRQADTPCPVWKSKDDSNGMLMLAYSMPDLWFCGLFWNFSATLWWKKKKTFTSDQSIKKQEGMVDVNVTETDSINLTTVCPCLPFHDRGLYSHSPTFVLSVSKKNSLMISVRFVNICLCKEHIVGLL